MEDRRGRVILLNLMLKSVRDRNFSVAFVDGGSRHRPPSVAWPAEN
jgi:hypothetical protein